MNIATVVDKAIMHPERFEDYARQIERISIVDAHHFATRVSRKSHTLWLKASGSSQGPALKRLADLAESFSERLANRMANTAR